jgi:hypothetical protein
MKISRIFKLLPVVFISACATQEVSSGSGEFSSYMQPRARYLQDRVVLEDPANASTRELALSIPAYESKDLEKFLSKDSERVSPGGDAWQLFGDGAQRPVVVKRLTPVGVNPVQIKVYLGGSPGIHPADYGAVYRLEKVPQGWKVLSVREGSSSELYRWPMD